MKTLSNLKRLPILLLATLTLLSNIQFSNAQDNATCCAYTVDYIRVQEFISSGGSFQTDIFCLSEDEVSGLITNQIYRIKVNGQILPLDYPYGYNNNSYPDLINDLAALGYNAWFESSNSGLPPPNQTNITFYFDASNGDVLNEYLVQFIDTDLNSDLSCCPLNNPTECCANSASYWFNDGIAIDPVTGLQTNQVYEITINGQVQPLNYPYGFGGNTNDDLINDLAALGFNAWFEYYTPPNSFTSQTIFYLDATNGDVLDNYLVYDVGVILDNDLSCCTPSFPDPCCFQSASYWYNNSISYDPVIGTSTNHIYEISINGQVLPLNYPYGDNGDDSHAHLTADLTDLGYTVWFEYNHPENSNTCEVVFYLDTSNGDILDGFEVLNVDITYDSDLSCCPPIEPDPCCVYTASYWFNDGIAIDPVTGLQTNQVYEITINGQVLPLNYPYGFGGNSNIDLINDLAALGFNAWFEYYTPPNSFTSQTIFYLDATNGDVLDDYLVYDVGVTLDSDLSCCPPIEPDPCCVYTASYWFNDGISIDPATGLQTNQVYEITINGQVLPLNYPYGFGGNTNTDLINDLAALGFNAWFEYYTPPNSFTSQTIFYLDASNGDVLDDYLVYDVGVTLDSDLSCCPPIEPDPCCVYTASYWFNDGIAIDPVTGLMTNQVYEISINGQVLPLNYPYGFGGNTNTDLINDLTALGFNAWFEYYTPPNSFTSQTIFYLDATNGDVLDDYLVYDVGVTLDSDLSCCPPIEPDPCCVYTASYWFNDGISIDPVTGLMTNQIYEIIINGQVLPLNYPYGFGGNTNTDLINDLAALGFNAWFEYYTPPNSFTSQTIFYLDATNGDVLDDYLVYDVGVTLDSDLSCCPPIEPDPCCVYTASYWFNDGIAIDPVTGLMTNQVYEISINGQVLPLNYPYGFGGNTNTDLINDLAALGFNAWFETYTPPGSFVSQTIFFLDATNGDVLDDYLVYDVGVTLDSDLSCCPPIEPDPCCVYTASYWFNDGISIDPVTGLMTNQIYEITINGQVLPLNYPYGFGGNTNTDLINDLAALGFNAWFETYTPPGSFVSQAIFFLDATNGDVLDDYLVYDVGVTLDSDLSCCPPTDPIYPCCAYIASLWLNDGISYDPVTGLYTNDIYEVIVNGQVLPLNYPYNLDSGADMDQLLADLAALGYYATLYTQNPSPFSYETVILFDPSNGDTLDAINVYDAGSSVTSDLSCCGITPPAFYCCKYDITLTHYGDDIMADLNGNVTADIQEIYVDGQLLPLNYSYNFNNTTDMDLLVADMAALGYTITYVHNANFFYQQTVITFEADNGNVVDSVTVFDADVSITDDLSCCPIINPVDTCCSYRISYVLNPVTVVDPATGYTSNDIYEIFINGELLQLNYPYSSTTGLDDLMDDLAILGYTATFETYQTQNNDTVVIINFDAEGGDIMINGFNVFTGLYLSISGDLSCCTSTPYNPCCSHTASFLFNDGLIIDPVTGLTTNDLYELSINGQVVPLNYPYNGHAGDLNNLIIDLAALGYTASYYIENPPGSFISIIHFYLDASNGDVLDSFEVFDVGTVVIESDLSCCAPIDPPIDTCCAVTASMWFKDALIFDPNTGLTTNDIFGLTVNGNTLPLNYPYSFGSTTDMDQLMADLAALGYNATYEFITPPQPSFTFEVVITFDVSNGDVLDAISIFDGNATLVHDYSCCVNPPDPPIDTCCAYVAEMWFNDGIAIDPNTGYMTNDILEIVINGQVVPLPNYPYNLGGGMDNLIDDLAALGFNASYSTYSEPGWFTYQVFLTLDASNGDVLDAVNLFGNYSAPIVGDTSCCLPPDPEPIDTCCAYIVEMWPNDAISWDPVTGYQTNDILEFVVNGQVLPLPNYPYNIGGSLDALIDDLAALGYTASFTTYSEPGWFTHQIIFTFDASNGDTLDAINLFGGYSPTVEGDTSCCLPPDPEPIDTCCAYIVEMWPNDAISWDPVTGYQTNDILEFVVNGQVLPLPNYPYNIGGSLDALIDDLAALGYTASYTTYSEPGWFTHQIIFTFDASNGDTLDAINLFGGYSPTVEGDTSCCLPPDPAPDPDPIICDGLWLEGFYDGIGSMQLPNGVPNLMPIYQPFSIAPWNYNGNEFIGSIPNFIRDWVLVSIRDVDGNVLDQKACLLSIDGGIYDTDLTNGLEFNNIPQGNFIISVHHKSHLSIGKLISNGGVIDFTDSSNVLGIQQMKIIDNIPMLYAGDLDNNGVINNLDYNKWKPNNSIVNTYDTFDCDGNGVINNQDYNLWKINKSKVGYLEIQY